ncbi:hypothetical protein F3Y22_tig00110391pilonHSYRG00086 [Hibiscus syriacus]|uniref:Uncharacterized protein n=1 Tax=Hibiscus syriacus TaxID=106335 RepID=A0A6A3APP6_HIBSY|nr:hypothetical protein F3Y22_tig00110391pilonHSYRG00086 [Hibiscus syriacus]
MLPKANGDENKSEAKDDEGKHIEGGSSPNNDENKSEVKDEGKHSESDNSLNVSLPNKTNTTDFVDQASSNSAEASKETSNMDSKANTEMPGSLQNGTSAQVDASKIEMVDSITTESWNSTNTESGMSDDNPRIKATAEGHNSKSSTTKENTDSTQNEKEEGDDEARGENESSDTSISNETGWRSQ